MDATVIAQLKQGGVETDLERRLPRICVERDPQGRLLPLQRIAIEGGAGPIEVELKTIPELFAGTRTPPGFERGPTPPYEAFFRFLEQTAVDCCSPSEPVYDREFERLYAQLRRRPLGKDGNRLFAYLQAAVRLYMSLRDVSRAEFEGVVQRLSRSAGHFATHVASANYLRVVSEHVS